jgi:probable HAF family extracellular repeat protein
MRKAGVIHAFIWRDGQMNDLGSLGGSHTSAEAINDHGWVVGSSTTAEEIAHAVVWKGEGITDLGTFARGVHQGSRAHDIDDRGRIVGSATVDSMNSVPVLWEDGRIRGLTDRYGGANAINSRGQVAGYLATSPDCFVWSQGRMELINPDEGPTALLAQGIDLPNRASSALQVEGIDRHGRVAGWTGHAPFIWHRGHFEWLPSLSTGHSQARAISDQGRFVVGGSSSTPDGLNPHPAVWTRH